MARRESIRILLERIERPELLALLHKNVAPQMDIGEYAMRIGHFDLVPILSGDKLIGVVMQLKNEVHMMIDVPYHKKVCCWRSGMKTILQPIIDKYGRAITKVPFTHMTERRFVERLGFKFENEQDGLQIFAMDTLKKGSKSCRQ